MSLGDLDIQQDHLVITQILLLFGVYLKWFFEEKSLGFMLREYE